VNLTGSKLIAVLAANCAKRIKQLAAKDVAIPEDSKASAAEEKGDRRRSVDKR
jgi:hypothetical protein